MDRALALGDGPRQQTGKVAVDEYNAYRADLNKFGKSFNAVLEQKQNMIDAGFVNVRSQMFKVSSQSRTNAAY